MSTPRRRRRRWLALAALGFGCLLAIGALEVFLRTFDPIGMHYHSDFSLFLTRTLRFHWEGAPPPGTPGGFDLDGRLFELKPDLDIRLGSFQLRSNAQGARGPALAVPKPADVFRIVVLGDSVVFGWGVDDEVTFVRRLEQEWRPAAGGKRLEVVNLGLPQYDTHQELASLRETGLALQPDVVLLVYVVNDIQPTRAVVAGHLSGTPVVDEFEASLPDDACSWLAGKLSPVLPATSALIGTFTSLDARDLCTRTLRPRQGRLAAQPAGPAGDPRSVPRQRAAVLVAGPHPAGGRGAAGLLPAARHRLRRVPLRRHRAHQRHRAVAHRLALQPARPRVAAAEAAHDPARPAAVASRRLNGTTTARVDDQPAPRPNKARTRCRDPRWARGDNSTSGVRNNTSRSPAQDRRANHCKSFCTLAGTQTVR
jgi:hypothetical protein